MRNPGHALLFAGVVVCAVGIVGAASSRIDLAASWGVPSRLARGVLFSGAVVATSLALATMGWAAATEHGAHDQGGHQHGEGLAPGHTHDHQVPCNPTPLHVWRVDVPGGAFAQHVAPEAVLRALPDGGTG